MKNIFFSLSPIVLCQQHNVAMSHYITYSNGNLILSPITNPKCKEVYRWHIVKRQSFSLFICSSL